MTPLPTFEVDKDGLAKLMARRGPSFALLELISNAWDEAATTVDASISWSGGKAKIRVEDDSPEGFADLTHAYRLFAESAKKADATKRGRFNLGEKLVIAVCDSVEIATTTGTIRFDKKGRTHSNDARIAGSVFSGTLKMTYAEYEQAIADVLLLIPPAHVTTTFNGAALLRREPIATFEEVLQTEIADIEGNLRRSFRKGTVQVFEPRGNEVPMLYELGIPVVPTGDQWHVSIAQKVPLNVDRDNVTPAYLRDVRRAVLDHCHGLLLAEDSGAKWIDDALSDEKVAPETVIAAMTARFGEKRVAHDPSDPEANKIAVANGYTVVASRSLSKDVWAAVKASGALPPAGQVTPSAWAIMNKNQGEDERKTIPPSQWTDGMIIHADFARVLAKHVISVPDLKIEMVNDQACRNFSATWLKLGPTSARLAWNVQTLGRAFFDRSVMHERNLALLIHEMAHQASGDHLSEDYYDEMCAIGARLANLIQKNPTFNDYIEGI